MSAAPPSCLSYSGARCAYRACRVSPIGPVKDPEAHFWIVRSARQLTSINVLLRRGALTGARTCLYRGGISFTKGRWLLWGYGRPVLAQRALHLYIPGAKKPETSNQQEKVTGTPVLSSRLEPTTHAQEPALLPLSSYNAALCVELLRPSLPQAGQSIWPHQRHEERRQQKHPR